MTFYRNWAVSASRSNTVSTGSIKSKDAIIKNKAKNSIIPYVSYIGAPKKGRLVVRRPR